MFIDSEIQQFGNTIGISNLRLNEKGCLKFSMQQNRTIYIEKTDDFIFFFILKDHEQSPLPYNTYAKALTMCSQQQGYPFPIQAIAKTDHDIGFLTKIHDNACDQPTIYRLFKFLPSLIDKIEQ